MMMMMRMMMMRVEEAFWGWNMFSPAPETWQICISQLHFFYFFALFLCNDFALQFEMDIRMHALFSSEEKGEKDDEESDVLEMGKEKYWEKRSTVLHLQERKHHFHFPHPLLWPGISVPWEKKGRYHTLPGRRDFIPRSCYTVVVCVCCVREAAKREPPNLFLIHQNTLTGPWLLLLRLLLSLFIL